MPKEEPIEVFMPPNILKAKVGSGGLDASVIKRAEEAVDELKDEFASWMTEDVQRLADARNTYEANRSQASLGTLYRAAHDLKGQAATFDFPLVARVASSLCKLTDESEQSLEMPLTLIDAHVDAIKVIVRDGIRDAGNSVANVLAEELERQVTAYLKKHAVP